MQAPSRIGKYELEEFLGGGMSQVYRAKDTYIGRTVVVKMLTPDACASPEMCDRFLQEARLAGSIAHENIVRIYDFGVDEGRPYLVMEFLEGEDLRASIKNGRVGNVPQKLDLALQIAKALDHIHSLNIIHRDVKPENVHVSPRGHIKVMDFGIAKMQGLDRTRTGFSIGSPFYMAPEQVQGAVITPVVDVYAFGMVLYELVAGVRPFKGDTIEQIFYTILHEPINLEPLRGAGLPASLIELIEACTAKHPSARPQTFSEIIARLERMQANLSSTDLPATQQLPVAEAASRAKNPRHWLFPAVAAALLVAAALVYSVRAPRAVAPVREENVQRAAAAVFPKTLETPTAEMMLVDAGPFMAGESSEKKTLPAFYVDLTEVTNDAYARYCAATGHALPPKFQPNRPDYPVTNITFDDALGFAAWAGKRIPTTEEWEKAARGTDGRLFPWGNEREPARANLADANSIKVGSLWPASTYGSDVSPSGARNMAGNVAEFVYEKRTPSARAVAAFNYLRPPATATEPWYTVRGGSFERTIESAVAYEWGSFPARARSTEIGFRCVKDP